MFIDMVHRIDVVEEVRGRIDRRSSWNQLTIVSAHAVDGVLLRTSGVVLVLQIGVIDVRDVVDLMGDIAVDRWRVDIERWRDFVDSLKLNKDVKIA